ncbi:hypothetical protein ABH977_008084 [Bradyrhizobium ottawaense]
MAPTHGDRPREEGPRSSAFISQCTWNGDRAMSANRREDMMSALLTNIRQLPTLHAESTFVLCPTA